jgi:archaellum component FlaC
MYVLSGVFVFWFGLLIWSIYWNLHYRREIERCMNISELLVQEVARPQEAGSASTLSAEGLSVFKTFRQARRLKESSPIARHLRAIFAAGWNESQLDVRGLVMNTTGELSRALSLHRALLSVFIILGLLGTLFGLADTLSTLDKVLSGDGQLNNARLNQGLQGLLGSMQGAFAPSILGVLLTVVSVVLFALYVRFMALPLGSLLERLTLTEWVPQLVPTSSQRLLHRMQLSKAQMERSVAAAREVTEFADEFQHKAGSLNQTMGLANDALQQMAQISARLGEFSINFAEGVKALTPFQQELKSLYQQMVSESRAFQESVQRNIAGAQDFQQHIQAQLGSQHAQLAQVLQGLNSYESAYLKSRQGIDEKLENVLKTAEEAFKNLSRRNEEIGTALDEALGKPLRETLTAHLGTVGTTLDTRLADVEMTLRVHLNGFGEGLRKLDAPLNTAAQKFTDTFFNFNEHTDEWRTTLQREFNQQNETNRQQLQRLDTLSEQIPALLQQLSASSNTFTEGGQQLRQDVNALSQNIETLGRSVDALSAQVVNRVGGGDDGTAELLARQTDILQQLAKSMERLAAARTSVRPSFSTTPDSPTAHERYAPPESGWRARIGKWIPFRGRR